jgi:hypothetical protein
MPPSETAAVSPPSSSAELAPEQQRVQRILKVIVGTLAILLFAGLAVAVARVIYLASAPVAQPSASALTPAPTPAPAIRPEQSLALPAGAQVRSVSLSGNRLAVHYDTGASSGIAVLDLQTGRTITNVAIETRAAGR